MISVPNGEAGRIQPETVVRSLRSRKRSPPQIETTWNLILRSTTVLAKTAPTREEPLPKDSQRCHSEPVALPAGSIP